MRACATSTAQIVGNTSTNDAVERRRQPLLQIRALIYLTHLTV
jgi:hypothetical protein